MKKLLLSLFVLLLALPAMAQVPQGFNFQSIARDGDGNIIPNRTLGVQITVLSDTSGAGTAVYTESHTVDTDGIGLFQIVIGEGNSSDDFSAINWSGSQYFVGLGIDQDGGTSYLDIGNSRLLSVPYAILAENVVNGGGGSGFTDFIQIDATDEAFQDSLTIIINGSETEEQFAFGLNAIGFSTGRNRPINGQIREDASNNASQFAVNGRADGLGGGLHFGVIGSAFNTDASNGGTRIGLYGQAASQSQFNFGTSVFVTGAGNGDIVPIGDPAEENGFGSFNVGYGGTVNGNANGNVGFDISVNGDQGARVNIGSEVRVETAAAGENIGYNAQVKSSTTSNIAYNTICVGCAEAGDATGLSLNVDALDNNSGFIINAGGGTAGNVGGELNVFGAAPDNTGLTINVNEGTNSNIGLIVNANEAAYLNGTVFVDGDLNYTGLLTNTSDRNLKENITDLEGGINTIMALRPTTYNFKQNYKGMNLATGLHYGLIAQEVEEVLPSLVKNNERKYTEKVLEGSGPDATEKEVEATMNYKSLNYTELVPILIKAMQEQQAEIEKLKKRLQALEEK